MSIQQSLVALGAMIDVIIDNATETEMKLAHLRDVVADVLASEPLPDDSAKKLLGAMEATR